MSAPSESERPSVVKHPQVDPRAIPDWEAVRLALEIVRAGSFRAAAEQLHVSVNLLRRRVDKLEETLGIKLLTRTVDGVLATAEGEKVFAVASRMESASFDLLQAHDETNPNISGEVNELPGRGAAVGRAISPLRALRAFLGVKGR